MWHTYPGVYSCSRPLACLSVRDPGRGPPTLSVDATYLSGDYRRRLPFGGLPPLRLCLSSLLRLYSIGQSAASFVIPTTFISRPRGLTIPDCWVVGCGSVCPAGFSRVGLSLGSFVCERDLKEITSAPRLQSPARSDLVTKPML